MIQIPVITALTAALLPLAPVNGLAAETVQVAIEELAARPSGGGESGPVAAATVSVDPIDGLTATDAQAALAELASREASTTEGAVIGDPIAFVRPAIYWSVSGLNLAVPNLSGGLRAPLSFTVPYQSREAISVGATGWGVQFAVVDIGGPELFDGIDDLVARANAAAFAVGLPPDTFYVDTTTFGIPSLVVQSAALSPAETASVPTEDGTIASWSGSPNTPFVLPKTAQIDAGQVYITAGKTVLLTEKLADLDRVAAKVATVQAGLAAATRFASTTPAAPGKIVGTVALGNDIGTIFNSPLSAFGIANGETFSVSEWNGMTPFISVTVSDAGTMTFTELMTALASQNANIDFAAEYDPNTGQYHLAFVQTGDKGATEHLFFGPGSEWEGVPAFGIGGRAGNFQPIKTVAAKISTTKAVNVSTADGSDVEAKLAAAEARITALEAAVAALAP